MGNVPVDIAKKTWLGSVIDSALEGYDPAAALLRLPPELRSADPDGPGLEARARLLLVRSLHCKLLDPPPQGGEDGFLGPVEGHVGLVLDIALVHGARFDAQERRAELATIFAALTGAIDLARAADPHRPRGGSPLAVAKALVRAGNELKARGRLPGDPKEGLPLRAGLLCIQRRHLARLAIGYYAGGQLDLVAARKLFDQAKGDTVLLVEALAAMAAATGPLGKTQRRAALEQVERLGLPRPWARGARTALRVQRTAAELARAAPSRLRPFLLEQLLLAQLAAAQPSPARAELAQAFADEAKIPPEQVAALQADAAALYADQQRWIDAGPPQPDEWETVADEWEEVADHMMEKVASAVTDNLEAIVTEIKETGELGELLAKAAAGHGLTGDEKAKVKGQLIDLAKAVPALAIFAAPGGMLLLPLLAKLLPFSVLPSAWESKGKSLRVAKKKAQLS